MHNFEKDLSKTSPDKSLAKTKKTLKAQADRLVNHFNTALNYLEDKITHQIV